MVSGLECFRIDESGYTGFDLLNGEQRLQGAAAIAISNEDASYLIKEFFPRLQAAELKYQALSRRPGNRPRLLALLRAILENYKCVSYVCDKRFLLIMMFLDLAVEPFYYERGVDFYQDGQNYALGSLLSLHGTQLLGEEAFNEMLASFQRAVKDKTPASLHDLLLAVRRTWWDRLPEALGPLAKYADPDCLNAISDPKASTDAALVVMIALISRMEVMAGGPYRVEHDQSKNLATYSRLLQCFIEHNDPIEFRATAITKFEFPLKLRQVTQVNSKNSPAVQLADVMIGAVIDAGNTLIGRRTNGLSADELFPFFASDQFIHMLPDRDFEAQREFRKGSNGADMIDYFATRFGKAYR